MIDVERKMRCYLVMPEKDLTMMAINYQKNSSGPESMGSWPMPTFMS